LRSSFHGPQRRAFIQELDSLVILNKEWAVFAVRRATLDDHDHGMANAGTVLDFGSGSMQGV